MKGWLILLICFLAVVLLTICVFTLAWLFIPFVHTWVWFKAEDGSKIISFVLALIQLGGIAIIALVVVLNLTKKRYRFVFNGFKNAKILSDVEQRPIDIDILAQEELVKQFKYLYCSLERYESGESEDSGGLDTNLLIKEPPFVNQYTQREDVHLLDLAEFLPLEEAENVVAELKNLIKSFQNREECHDLLSMIGESAPKEISPLMKIIDAIRPPRIVEATGHLQWRGKTLEPHNVGITLEFAGSFTESDETMTRTIWWQHINDKVASASRRVVSTRVKRRGFSIVDRTKALPCTVNMLEVTEHYIELLAPAMCWLALTLWEYHYILHHPKLTHHRWAKLHYLLGALYCAYSQEMHSEYGDFFWARAVEHFDQAIKLDPDWCKPYLYVATIYSNQLQPMQANEPHYKEALNSALQRYNEFRQHVQGAKKRLQSQMALWPKHLKKMRVPIIPSLLHFKKIREVSLILQKLIVAQVTTALNSLNDIGYTHFCTVLATNEMKTKKEADIIRIVHATLQETIQKAGLIKDKADMNDFLINAMQNAGLIKTALDDGHIKVMQDASLIKAMSNEELAKAMVQVISEGFKGMLEWLNDEKFKLGRRADSTYLFSLACLYYLSWNKYIDVSFVRKEAPSLLRESLMRSPELWGVAKENAGLFHGHENLENLKEKLDEMYIKNPKLSKLRGKKFKESLDEFLNA